MFCLLRFLIMSDFVTHILKSFTALLQCATCILCAFVTLKSESKQFHVLERSTHILKYTLLNLILGILVFLQSNHFILSHGISVIHSREVNKHNQWMKAIYDCPPL